MNKTHCICGAQTDGTAFCSGLCESEYHEVMVALGISQKDTSLWIENYADSFKKQYPEEDQYIVDEVLLKHGVSL